MQPFGNLYLQKQSIGMNAMIKTGTPILCDTDQQPESSLKEKGKQTKTGNHATFWKFVLPGSKKIIRMEKNSNKVKNPATGTPGFATCLLPAAKKGRSP
jgi:hypothetical protein